jgi:hypothetical protein
MKIPAAVLATHLAVLSMSCSASNLYCKIVNVSDVVPSGALKRLTGTESTRKGAEGTDFIINRETGLMLGKHVNNDVVWWDTEVVDYGSNVQSYKAFSKNRQGYRSGQYIQVKLWEAGEKKPFVLFDDEILTGYCTL